MRDNRCSISSLVCEISWCSDDQILERLFESDVLNIVNIVNFVNSYISDLVADNDDKRCHREIYLSSFNHTQGSESSGPGV